MSEKVYIHNKKAYNIGGEDDGTRIDFKSIRKGECSYARSPKN